MYNFMILFIYLGMVNSFPIMEDEEEYNEDNDDVVGFNSFRHVFSRHKRSANDTAAVVDGRSAIERFYDDPNNKAMFLVFPIFVLIICTCCGLYFCDKAKRHFKKKKAEQRKRENDLMANEEQMQNKPSSSNSIEDTTEITPVVLNKDSDEMSTGKSAEMEVTDSNRNDTPLEDLENCPEVKAVNAVPIKHRETSFMTDVRNANSSELVKTSNTNTPIRDIKSADKVTKSFENGHVEKLTQSKSDLNANIIMNGVPNSRSSSKQSTKSIIKTQSPIKKKVEIKEKKTLELKKIVTPTSDDIANSNNSNPTPEVIKPSIVEMNAWESKKSIRRQSLESTSTTKISNRSLSPDTRSSRTMSVHGKTSPPDVTKTKGFPKINKNFTSLSPEAIVEILQYYKDKKHMPDIIPDDSENLVPLKKRLKKGKYRVFNG